MKYWHVADESSVYLFLCCAERNVKTQRLAYELTLVHNVMKGSITDKPGDFTLIMLY